MISYIKNPIELISNSDPLSNNIIKSFQPNSHLSIGETLQNFYDSFISINTSLCVSTVMHYLYDLLYIEKISDKKQGLNILSNLMNHLKNDLVKFSESIFPTLLAYSYFPQNEISQLANSIIQNYLSTSSRREHFIKTFHKSFDQWLSITHDNLFSQSSSAEPMKNSVFDNVTFCFLCLTSEYISITHKFICINSLSKYLPTTSNHQFSAQTSMKIYLYLLTSFQNDFLPINPEEVMIYLGKEDRLTILKAVLKLTSLLITKKLLPKDQISQIFYVRFPKLVDIFGSEINILIQFGQNELSDPTIYEKCIQVIAKKQDPSSIELFSTILQSYNESSYKFSKEILSMIRQSAISNTSFFWTHIPLEKIEEIGCEPVIPEINTLKIASKNRQIELISKADNDNKSLFLQYLKETNKPISPQILIHFSPEAIRSTWEKLSNIPYDITDGKKDSLLNFFAANASAIDIPWLLRKHSNELPIILIKYSQLKRDLSIFENSDFSTSISFIIRSKPETIPIILQIFSISNNELDDKVHDIILKEILNLVDNNIDQELLNKICNDIELLKPTNEFLTLLVIKRVSFPNDHPIISKIAETFKTLSFTNLENAHITANSFANLCKTSSIDPHLFANPIESYDINLLISFWILSDYDFHMQLVPKEIAILINKWILFNEPWISEMLFINTVERSIIFNPNQSPFKEVIAHHSLKEIAIAAHELGLLPCLVFLYNSSHTKDFSLPNDSLSEKLFILTNQPLISFQPKTQIDTVILMESGQITPEPPQIIEDDIYSMWQMILSLEHNQINSKIDEYYQQIIDISKIAIKSNDKLKMLLAARLLSKLENLNYSPFLLPILHMISQYQSIPECIIHSFQPLFVPTSSMSNGDFEDIFINSLSFISNDVSGNVSNLLLPMMIFYKEYSLLSQLDLNKVPSWLFIIHCFPYIPEIELANIISLFSSMIPQYLPLIINQNPPNLHEIFASFSATIFTWSRNINPDEFMKISELLQYHLSTLIFKFEAESLSKTVALDPLLQTKISINQQKATIDFSYGAYSLSISLPPTYPLKRPIVKCVFTDKLNSEKIERKVLGILGIKNGLKAGYITWKKEILSDHENQTLCHICYEHIKRVKNITCKSCNKMVHQTCLEKWFSQSMKHLCPYCGAEWN